jgi:hypothetical protein
MIIDEGQLEILRAWHKGELNIGGVGFAEGLEERFKDIASTMDQLWLIARCARTWLNANPGQDSTEAEAELQKKVDAIFSAMNLPKGRPPSKEV